MDLKEKRIPNWLTFTTILLSLLYHAISGGFDGLFFSLKGLLVGMAILMLPYFSRLYGNPSALHKIGDEATEALERSRAKVARFINAAPAEIIFTSGATESNNALISYAMRNRTRGDHIIMSEIEHISLHNVAKYLT